jgi:serine/threonine-protein kinase haspin
MDSQTRRKVRAVYGKKSTKNISASTAAVFLPTPDSSPAATKGTSVGPSISPPPSINVPDSSSDPASLTASTLTSVLQPIDRAPLDDITEALSNVKLNDDTKDPNVPPVQSTKPGNRVLRDKTRKAGKPHPVTATSDTLQADSRLKWLKPLLDAYSPEADGEQLEIQKWSDMGFDSCDLTKMAESSFAEVYKVMNDLGTSVLKIIALKPPSGPGSRRDTSSPVNDVISEVVIMNMMAEIYGFLEFKQAHLVEGKPSRPFVAAYDAFAIKKTTYFPHPSVYHNEQVFLVLELGDAGTDVENSVINQPSQLWDTFLGVTLAIATGETEFEFEVRSNLAEKI